MRVIFKEWLGVLSILLIPIILLLVVILVSWTYGEFLMGLDMNIHTMLKEGFYYSERWDYQTWRLWVYAFGIITFLYLFHIPEVMENERRRIGIKKFHESGITIKDHIRKMKANQRKNY